MVSKLLRIMEIPHRVEGHGKVNLQEEALKIAQGLYECKWRTNVPFPACVEHALNRFALDESNLKPKYYDEMARVYDTVLLMVNEIAEYDDSSSVCGLITKLEEYKSEAQKQKTLSLLNLKKQKIK